MISLKFAKKEIPDYLSVRSIVSVWHMNLLTVKNGDEEHDFPELFYVENGEHTVLLDDVPYHLDKGQVIIYAPHAFHRSVPGKVCSADVGIIGFEADTPDIFSMCNKVMTLTDAQKAALDSLIEQGTKIFVKTKSGITPHCITLREGISQKELQLFKHRLELFLIDVFGVCEAPSDNRGKYKREQFNKVVEYMKRNLSKSLSLEGIAAVSSMSPSKLSGLFKEQSGIGPITYLNKLRISEAQRLIRDTSMNFTEISELVGMGSIHYFSRLFKKLTDTTPSEYAASLTKNKSGMEP